ncbi:Imm53 family immunity protein [Aestuariivirga sp.]|uniref:Imm53 family immunity protein n=1 Tax=Aestuariivirga sp. TaxID=2650926 RepID=UPI003918C1C5
MDPMERLQRWYIAQCDGEWEHDYGVVIESLDNPGWRISIGLRGTALEARDFVKTAHGAEAEGPDWWVCWVEDHKFLAASGPASLLRIIEIFCDWAEA